MVACRAIGPGQSACLFMITGVDRRNWYPIKLDSNSLSTLLPIQNRPGELHESSDASARCR